MTVPLLTADEVAELLSVPVSWMTLRLRRPSSTLNRRASDARAGIGPSGVKGTVRCGAGFGAGSRTRLQRERA